MKQGIFFESGEGKAISACGNLMLFEAISEPDCNYKYPSRYNHLVVFNHQRR